MTGWGGTIIPSKVGHCEAHPVTFTHIQGEKPAGLHLYHFVNGLVTHKGIFANLTKATKRAKELS